MFIPADKTNNHYKLQKEEYKKLLKDNTTAKYRRTSTSQTGQINAEAKCIAEKLQLDDRIETLAQKPAFITIKDHKDNFPNHVQCRLINPAKSEIGIVSKSILDRINKDIIKATNTYQWKNTNSVIEWFTSITNKQSCSFLTFDVVEFYPSITQKLLHEALDFASNFTDIKNEEKEIIMHTKKTLLFHDDSPWHKSNPPYLFDITMGCYDGAETCELIGTYLLSKVKHMFDNEVGLYRDDGLAVLRNHSPSKANKVAKQLTSEFKKLGLRITTDQGIKIVNFLDVTFNLRDESYRPYTKPNNTTHYVNKKSNHPKAIIKTIPSSVNQRLSNISSDEQLFDATTSSYQDALNEAGYNHTLKFDQTRHTQRKRNRSRNITWFNPPYSKHVSTNIGRKFLNLIDKHFPISSVLHKIFNRNNTKVSYSCMDNMGKLISGHNKAILSKAKQTQQNTCNCRKPKECPLAGKCLIKSVVYKATVTTNQDHKSYIGVSDTEFKSRFNNHKSSFKLDHKKKDTALSKYIWHLKDSNINYDVHWSVLKQASSYSNVTKRCQLCLWEKYFIITADKSTNLNSRTELISKCRHANKFLLNNT